APVREIESGVESASPAEPSAASSAPRARSLTVTLAAAAIVAIALAGAVRWYASVRVAANRTAVPQTIAFLPFAVAGDRQAEFVGVALTDALITRFAMLSRLQPLGIESSMRYTSPQRDARSIGRALNANWVLDGAV